VPTAAFTTLGCKVNQYETQKILESFEERGFQVVPFDSQADVYVINTCSVTSDAERKSRYTIRRAARSNPDGKIVVTGCASQMSANLGESMEHAHVSVPNADKLRAVEYFLDAFPGYESRLATCITEQAKQFSGRTRATLKVQDGCSVFCSYCSIPYTRPVMSSRPVAEVLDEAKRLADAGFLEIILTGVLIGSYGPETGSGGPRFAEMVERVARESGVPRIRISSIEMQEVTDPLIDLLAEGLVVPHLHIPLQSGDSQVLADMNRPYRQADYLALCEKLYSRVPGLSISADVMVGFPTETHERFLSSVHVCQQVQYVKTHVFTFSPRHGTPADQWGDPVQPTEKVERRLHLSRVAAECAEQHMQKFVGKVVRVLVEGKVSQHGTLEALSDNYIPVRLAGSTSLTRSLQWVRIDEVKSGVAFGEVVSGPSVHSNELRVLTRDVATAGASGI
jgi:threonylcarbamoyladenosine tRNA methylthiotransferase MtaB